MITELLSIPRRFNGPPHSGNGGYVCGRLAGYLTGSVGVRLRQPPPLERELRVEVSDDEAQLLDGETLIAQARRMELDIAPASPPSFAEAEAASKSYAGFTRHPLPTCFVCGPQRLVGDGLRIFPGATVDGAVLAAPWIPHVSLADDAGQVRPEFVWAALDCAGAFAVMPPSGLILLGELHARLDSAVKVGEPCVVAAWPLGVEGRKHFAGTAVFSSERLAAMARATWIEVPAT